MKAYLLTCGLAAFLTGCSGVDRGFPPPSQAPVATNRQASTPPPSVPSWQQYNRSGPSAYGSPQAGAVASLTPPSGDPLHGGQRTPYGSSLASAPPAAPQTPVLIPESRQKDSFLVEAPTGGIQRVSYEQPQQQPQLQPPLRGIAPETLPRGSDGIRGATLPALVPGTPQPLLTAFPETTEKPAGDPAIMQSPARGSALPSAAMPPRTMPMMPSEPVAVQPRTEEKDPPALVPSKFEEKVVSPPQVAAKPVEEKPTTAGSPAVRMINSKRIVLNFEMKDIGPSGVSMVELWYTRDGRTWQKDDSGTRAAPPYVFEVPEEGMYGFTLVARNGIGLGKEPPKQGDLPQVWVEVDLTRPTVNLVDIQHGNGDKAREVTFTWEAHDRNLARRPITLSYATAAAGPWYPLKANIENTGNYTWLLPQNGPMSFFTRIEAVDMVGNVGVAQTAKPMSIDTSLISTSILGVESGEK